MAHASTAPTTPPLDPDAGLLEQDTEWDEDIEETGPWCVDQGASMRVMTTRDIYQAVARGNITPDTKVWRDGRACWLPIAECYELTVEPPEVGSRTPPRPLVKAADPGQPVTLMLTTSFAVGLLIGALLYLPFAW